jgi:hypothetical protein
LIHYWNLFADDIYSESVGMASHQLNLSLE